MTREEAIEVLKRFRKVIGLNDDLKRALDKRDIPLLDMAIEALSADAVQGGDAEMDNCQAQAPQNYMQQSRHNDGTDLISRADAIKAVASITMSIHLSEVICDKLLALPSAEAKPTVIRSKTLLPTKDFKEWAKRVRETNPNVIVIPCDAEVVSADAVHGEWKFVDHEIFAGEYFCSVCGKRAEVDLYGEWILSNYCGHCGTRMKGGAE